MRITYQLKITARRVIRVEDLIDAVSLLDRGYHEEIADALFHEFGETQTLSAFHHGVLIVTTRAAKQGDA